MKYALVDGIRTEASKGVKGVCPSCGSELIAKCGKLKINHWAHKGNRNCDPWWEPETDWHRIWKNCFPSDWQENSLRDERSNEKHIADVLTSHDLVIEFQHSFIKSQERTAREVFYQNMVWIVDGARLKRDYPRFLKAQKEIRRTGMPKIFTVEFAYECFPKCWLESSVPVIFDFKGTDSIIKDDDVRKNLYCLFPALPEEDRMIGRIFSEISRRAFIKSAINGEWASRVQGFMEKRIASKREQQNLIAKEERKRVRIAFNKFLRRNHSPYRKRRL